MKSVRSGVAVLLLLSWVQLACAFLTPTGAAPEAATSVPPSAIPTAEPSAAPSAGPSVEPSVEAALPTATARPILSPSPTIAPLDLVLVQHQVWEDRHGDARASVLVRNPYDFPVAPGAGSRATLRNGAGEVLRDGGFYFLDGISGGNGFILPGETVAADVCFTCEEALLAEPWSSIEFVFDVVDATGAWDYSTDVVASVGDVSFDGDSAIFWVTGSVKNNSETTLQRISVRFFVFDQAGTLVGAAESSAWDVGPGASADVSGYGIGQPPAGPVEYEVTALGVNY